MKTYETKDSLEEAITSAIDDLEEEGIDFKEEVGRIILSLPSREDLYVEVYVVDKQVHELFNQHEEYLM